MWKAAKGVKLWKLKKDVLVDGLMPGYVTMSVSVAAMGADGGGVIFKCGGWLHSWLFSEE